MKPCKVGIKPRGTSNKCSETLFPECGKTVHQAFTSTCHQHLTSAPTTKTPLYVQRYQKCMDRFRTQGNLCRTWINQKCTNTSIQAAKLTKVALETLEQFITNNPHTKVLYYIRDPRGILNSRCKSDKLSDLGNNNIVTDATLLCRLMHEDYLTWTRLKEQYPDSIEMFKYENFTAQPRQVAEKVYEFINSPLPEELATWLSESMNSKTATSSRYSTSRKNSTATASRWRKELSQKVIAGISSACQHVLFELGYEK